MIGIILGLVAECVAAVTAVTVASLVVADRMHRRQVQQDEIDAARESADPKAMRAAIAEKRRVIERARESRFIKGTAEGNAVNEINGYDAELIKLAEEEARIPRENPQ